MTLHLSTFLLTVDRNSQEEIFRFLFLMYLVMYAITFPLSLAETRRSILINQIISPSPEQKKTSPPYHQHYLSSEFKSKRQTLNVE